MARYIRAEVTASAQTGTDVQGYRFRVEVVEAVEITDKIFRYLMMEKNPRTNEEYGRFDGVCDPYHIETIPEDEPTTGSDPAWFRLNYVDLIVETRSIADEALELIQEDIEGLLAAYDRMDTLQTTLEWEFGTAPDSSSSS
jgi:hypothetical protein